MGNNPEKRARGSRVLRHKLVSRDRMFISLQNTFRPARVPQQGPARNKAKQNKIVEVTVEQGRCSRAGWGLLLLMRNHTGPLDFITKPTFPLKGTPDPKSSECCPISLCSWHRWLPTLSLFI